MLFNSFAFIYFILTFIPIYFFTKGRTRLLVCLISSYVFYGWWDYRFLLLIIILTLVNYFCGLKIPNRKNVPQKRNSSYFIFSIVSSLSILGAFKYYNFFVDNFISILSSFGFKGNFTSLEIILPVGISFYTFQTLSYTIDIYRNKLQPEQSLLNFATFVAFFPQLVAGPIVRASCFIPQLKSDRLFKSDNVINGIHLIIWGYFLKVVIADSLSIVVDVRFENPANQNPLSMLVGVIFYAFQIYGDFAGYSLIAIGIARILGFEFPANFNRPYFSQNFVEFWKRWHISLSSWLRDYLYISLGGNRFGKLKMYRNLMLTMLLGGLWHGASWNFVIWGGLHGIFLILQRLLKNIVGETSVPKLFASNIIALNISKIIKIFFTFSMVCLAWIFFRSRNINESFLIIENIFQFNDYHFSAVTQKFHVIKGFAIIAALILIESLSFHINFRKFKTNHPYIALSCSAYVIVSIALLGTFGNSAFIYFQF